MERDFLSTLRDGGTSEVNPAQHVLLLAVRLYRWAISPALATLFGPAGGCRFTPDLFGLCGGSGASPRRIAGQLARREAPLPVSTVGRLRA